MKIELNKNFAPNSAVDVFDIRQMKKALNRLGYYMPRKDSGINGIADGPVFTALKRFQEDRGLKATGVARPNDKTVSALNEALDETPDGKYIWRTVGDADVRPEHADLADTVRSYADSPDPGEDYNCRCWAEKVEDIDDPPLKPVYPELLLIPTIKIGKVVAKAISGVLKNIFEKKNYPIQKNDTSHGALRRQQRGITNREIEDAIESAKKAGTLVNKMGKYGTPQTVYQGSNGVTVIVETQGRNAGKIITVWKN